MTSSAVVVNDDNRSVSKSAIHLELLHCVNKEILLEFLLSNYNMLNDNKDERLRFLNQQARVVSRLTKPEIGCSDVIRLHITQPSP